MGLGVSRAWFSRGSCSCSWVPVNKVEYLCVSPQLGYSSSTHEPSSRVLRVGKAQTIGGATMKEEEHPMSLWVSPTMILEHVANPKP